MDGDNLIKKIGNELLDLVYPPGLYCICCGKITDDSRTYRLCNDCMQAINWNTGRRCSKCGRPLSENDPGDRCFTCMARGYGEGRGRSGYGVQGLEQADRPARGRYFDRGHACAGYGACEQSMIFALKYGSRSDIGDTLGEMMYDYMAAEYGAGTLAGMYDLVVPVPTHIDKKRKRGYNHAELIARGFARRAGLRHSPDVVIRARSTRPMKGLSPGERMANIRGAFEIRGRLRPLIAGARILLIDDIFTTGATIDEIARVLKNPDAAANGGRFTDTGGYSARHAARPSIPQDGSCSTKPPGAARVDFLAFAAAGDIII